MGRSRGLPEDLTALAAHPEVHALLAASSTGSTPGTRAPPQVKRFAVLDRHLTQETGELTPTFKVKRAVLHTNHADLFDTLYHAV